MAEPEALRPIERRVLTFLDQRGPTHRRLVVFELASPDSKIGRARDIGGLLGGGSSSNGEALIMGGWVKRLVKWGWVRSVTRSGGFYRHHEITSAGRVALRDEATKMPP